MATADIINSIKTNITNVYSAIEAKNGTIPANKNLEGMAAAISSIPASSGSAEVEDIATIDALKAKCIAANAGSVYRYTGTTSGDYVSGSIYTVVYNGDDNSYDLGFDAYKKADDPYTITWNLTNVSINFNASDPSSTMGLCGEVLYNLMNNGDYSLPDTITVTGCSYEYSKANKTLKLYNPTGNITVTIVGENDTTASAYTIMNMFNQDLKMKPVMDGAKAIEFYEAYAALNGADQQNFITFYNVMTQTALPLMQKGTDEAYDEVYALIVKETFWEKCNWSVSDVTVEKGRGLDITLKSPTYKFYWLTEEIKN